MTEINRLPIISRVQSNNLLPLYQDTLGAAGRVSVSTLLSYFQSAFASPTAFTQSVTPGEGANIAIVGQNAGQSVWLLLRPAAALTNLTITLPLNTSCVDKQEVEVSNIQAITNLFIGANGATAVYGAPTGLASADKFRLRFDVSTNSWYAV